MVNPFKFARTPEIHFGIGKINILPAEIKKRGKNALIITGEQSFIGTKYWEELKQHFNNGGIYFSNEKVSAEPSPLLIDNIVGKYHNEGIDVVIAIGGGSVLDSGKAISAMLPLNEPIKDYLEGVGKGIEHPGVKVPFIAIPTTSGTGSETTKNAVISEIRKDGFKKSLRHDNFVPDVAIVDPVLTMNCSPFLTATCGMDAFTQLLESYVSTKANPLSDALAFSGLEKAVQSIRVAFDGTDSYVKTLDARRNMAYASMVSGITLANAGLGVVHGIASTLGGYFDIPHGVICGTLMGQANTITIKKLLGEKTEHLAIEKYSKVGRLFSDNEQDKDSEYYCRLLCDKMDELIETMQIPRLSEFGISEKDLKLIANKSENKNNPVKLTEGEIVELLKNRL